MDAVGSGTSVQVVPSVDFSTTNDVSVIELSLKVSVAVALLKAGHLGQSAAVREHRPHHVHLLVAEDVAVIDVLPTEVDERVITVVDVAVRVNDDPVWVKVGTERHIGLSGRMLFGTSKGTTGMIGRRATIVSSSGLTRMVSFQPSSDGSGGMMMLSQVTRLRIWTLNRWKWNGCVSTPLWVIFQIWVPSATRRDRL